MCTVQCGGIAAKALNFIFRAAGSKHHETSIRRVFTYVGGGRMRINDAYYFMLDMEKKN